MRLLRRIRFPRKLPIAVIAAAALSLSLGGVTSAAAAGGIPTTETWASNGNLGWFAQTSDNVTVLANNGNTLMLQTDGNLVLYHHGVAVWQTGTYVHHHDDFSLQTDGNMVVYNETPGLPGATALWQSHTYGHNASKYQISLSTTGVFREWYLSSSGWKVAFQEG